MIAVPPSPGAAITFGDVKRTLQNHYPDHPSVHNQRMICNGKFLVDQVEVAEHFRKVGLASSF